MAISFHDYRRTRTTAHTRERIATPRPFSQRSPFVVGGRRPNARSRLDAWAVDCDRSALRRLSRPTWIAVIGQLAVGFTDLERDGHLDMMFVDPAHQGVGVATPYLIPLRRLRAHKVVLGYLLKLASRQDPF
jgi:GNAT superfamily N-acetyltransferase